jgi:hypothetical protein
MGFFCLWVLTMYAIDGRICPSVVNDTQAKNKHPQVGDEPSPLPHPLFVYVHFSIEGGANSVYYRTLNPVIGR